nr:hypothetical protein [Tanacetum cinerariifolium]
MEEVWYCTCHDECERILLLQIHSVDGMNGVLESRTWFIQSVHIILKKWMPNASLLKEDLLLVPMWVKLHDIPIMGRLDYARALIDGRANREFKEEMITAIHNVEDDGEVPHTVRVEYDWNHLDVECIRIGLFTMASSHNQAIVDTGSENHPPMIEKRSYVPWSSRSMRYIHEMKEFGKILKESIANDPYQIKEIEDQGYLDGHPPVPPFTRFMKRQILQTVLRRYRCDECNFVGSSK